MTTNLSKILQIYVLPSLNGSYTIHPRFLSPVNKVEHGALFASFVIRKWRYQFSDTFGVYWHSFGRKTYAKNSMLKHVYTLGNRVTTRKAQDEYFFKMIPTRTEEVQFIYPSNFIKESKLKAQISTWLSGILHFT